MELNQNIKVIIFDFDGTLFDLDVNWDDLKQRLNIEEANIKIGDVIQIYRDQNHPNLKYVTDAELQSVGKRRLDAEVQDVLLGLGRKCKLAVFTRNSRKAVESAVLGTPLEKNIVIIGREDTKHLKPHPEGLSLILDHFKCSAKDAVLVGDTFHDVEAAHALGLTSIIIKNIKLAYVPDGADGYIENLSELLST